MWFLTKVYATCVFVLYVKYVITTYLQATKEYDAGERPPEDNKLSMARGRPEQSYAAMHGGNGKEHADAYRWRRIVQNDLENIPFALVVFGADILAGAQQTLCSLAMCVFVGARIAHTYLYATEKQPHRTISYLVGVVCVFIGAVAAMAGAYAQQ